MQYEFINLSFHYAFENVHILFNLHIDHFLFCVCCLFCMLLFIFRSRYSPARISLRRAADMKLPKQIIENALTNFR